MGTCINCRYIILYSLIYLYNTILYHIYMYKCLYISFYCTCSSSWCCMYTVLMCEYGFSMSSIYCTCSSLWCCMYTVLMCEYGFSMSYIYCACPFRTVFMFIFLCMYMHYYLDICSSRHFSIPVAICYLVMVSVEMPRLENYWVCDST